ncbi:MAG TPA: recombination protein O N-terminal domain-containing protein, partial [Myxococcota bacterium]|nr:recombination protein O N-terminal domain-containing protein [Myxococcota bacterium]
MSREYVGVLIGRQDLGETDRVLRFLTPDVGRLSVVARGARRPRSPFATADLGSRVRITVEEGPWELQRLQGLELEEARVGLRADLDRLYGML